MSLSSFDISFDPYWLKPYFIHQKKRVYIRISQKSFHVYLIIMQTFSKRLVQRIVKPISYNASFKKYNYEDGLNFQSLLNE